MIETSVNQTSLEKQSIKVSEIDPKFKYELVKLHGSEKILRCFQCGICTSDCPIARYNGSYRPRTFIHMAVLGLKDRVLKDDALWLCAACFACSDRCPQNIEVASVIRVFRNLAVENDCVPQVFKEQIESILETGYAFRIPELRIKKREAQNLPPLPKGNVEKLCKVFKGIKFVEKIQRMNGDHINVNHQQQ
ncbi:MAG: 4Fe-4S dicluster domain-containing protein [Candidatus Bathyarchaeota archaeon]|nr:4Fe-4S dicluster domain-containing protein [Candidatus Termiticorpusculum sp.]